MRAAATTREVELLRSNVTTVKSQLQQLQELLATREQEHRYVLKNINTVELIKIFETLGTR